MRIFITGGAGFIGTHLCKKLLELNHNVTVYDNFSNSSKENFVSEIKQKITLISGDILDNSKLVSSMKNHDVVIHLAAKISVSESVKNPKETFDVNVNGTQNVLNSCEKNKISKIIVTSTAAVYQNISTKIILDESSVTNPSSPYGSSKLAMEDMINDFTQTHDVNAIILRLFNVYGVGQSPEYAGVITKFLSAAKDNSPLTIFGDGSQTRDFVHVKDVINAIILSIDSSNFGLYNVATGTSTSILNLAHLIIEQSDKKLDVVFQKQQTGDIQFSHCSISKIKQSLGFLPQCLITTEIKTLMTQ